MAAQRDARALQRKAVLREGNDLLGVDSYGDGIDLIRRALA